MKIHFGHFIHALTNTIDLVGVDEIQHGKRVGFMALECAKIMGFEEKTQQKLFHSGLLHDCGVSSTKIHKKLVDELDWTESQQHCLIGSKRLKSFEHLAEYADITLFHHTRWKELERQKIPEITKDLANLIFLLDRVDALVAMNGHPNRLAIRDSICKKVNAYRGNFFKPELVDVFMEVAEKEAFWITQQPEHLQFVIQDQCGKTANIHLNTEQLTSMATIFAEIVDAKSPYTAEHSLGVARLAGHFARKCQLPTATIAKVEVAALLHDLGKLQVPDSILDFDGGLEGESLAIMRHHSYVTKMILQRIIGFEDICSWAANHHEKLDGSGYPFRKKGSELSIESRIIMVADIFQALAQNRPYRSSMSTHNIIDFLSKQGSDGKIDREIVAIAEAEPTTCYRIATTQ